MIDLKPIYNKYKVLIHNMSYLTLLKGLTLILPLLTFPYLIQTLGAENYGLVMWVWALAEIFIVIVKFGFDTLGVKLISENRHDTHIVSKIFSQITYIKLSLYAVCCVIFIIMYLTLDRISNNTLLFGSFALFVLFESMLPVWYFQGIENMKILALLVSGIKLAFALLVFVFVKQIDDFLYIPVLYSVGSLIANLFAYYIVISKHKISFIMVKYSDLVILSKESFFILLATLGTVIRDRITILLIERFLGLTAVAYFDLALRVTNILLTPFHIVSTVIYPFMAKTKDIAFFKRVLLGCLSISIIVVFVFVYNVDIIANLVSADSNTSFIQVLSILIYIVPIGLCSSFIATNIHVVFNQTKWLSISILSAVIVYFLVFIIFLQMSMLDLTKFAYLYLIFFATEMLVLLLKSKKILQKETSDA